MRRHIVVIEDDRAICQLLEDALGPYGYEVQWIGDGKLVSLLDPAEDPDLILMDLMLPGLNGVELTRQLRANGFAHTPIVAISASHLHLHFARNSGLFQACLAKPFDLSELLACLEHYAGLYVTMQGTA